MSDKRYNGWANYATWRVNLEIVSDLSDPADEYFSFDKDTTARELGEQIESYVAELLDGYCDKGPVRDYCDAFLDDVDWSEIAQHILDDAEFEDEDEDD